MAGWTLSRDYRFARQTVCYDIRGDGPAMVLVHNAPWSSYSWRNIIPELIASFLVEFFPSETQNVNRQIDRWRVLRQDDNGNRFVVASDLSEEQANRLVRELAARRHKQTYWAEADAVQER